jgi:hypothetical protein
MESLPQAVIGLGIERGSGNTRAQKLLATDHARLLGDNPAQARRDPAVHADEYAGLYRHSRLMRREARRERVSETKRTSGAPGTPFSTQMSVETPLFTETLHNAEIKHW